MRQFFINLGSPPPTPAMTKALMVNTARYMTGMGANDTLPSNNQGMGEANVQSFFDVFAADLSCVTKRPQTSLLLPDNNEFSPVLWSTIQNLFV